MMKKFVPVLFCVVLAAVYAQEILENPKTPQNEIN